MSEFQGSKRDLSVESNNELLAKQLFEAIDKQDTNKVKEMLSTDFGLTAPGIDTPINADALIKLMTSHYSSFPDWKHNVEYVMAKNDKVFAKVLQEGTHKAEYEGIPATDKHVYQAQILEITFENGRIKDLWAIEDYLGLYKQLGMELKSKNEELSAT